MSLPHSQTSGMEPLLLWLAPPVVPHKHNGTTWAVNCWQAMSMALCPPQLHLTRRLQVHRLGVVEALALALKESNLSAHYRHVHTLLRSLMLALLASALPCCKVCCDCLLGSGQVLLGLLCAFALRWAAASARGRCTDMPLPLRRCMGVPLPLRLQGVGPHQ